MIKWLPQADDAIKKVPLFVRKKARQRVEKQVSAEGREVVRVEDVQTAKKRFLSKMDEDVKGFQVEACFGPQGCPNRIIEDESLIRSIETVFSEANLRFFLEQTVNSPLKFHHEFRVALADCPNACSQPQIKDIGIIGAAAPERTDAPCTECGACQDVCREAAVVVDPSASGPIFDWNRCVQCGQCIKACPTGAIGFGMRGYRLLIGGKLGRHPRLAMELPGLYDADTVLHLVKWCVQYYKRYSSGGERFAAMVEKAGAEFFDLLLAEAYHYGKENN